MSEHRRHELIEFCRIGDAGDVPRLKTGDVEIVGRLGEKRSRDAQRTLVRAHGGVTGAGHLDERAAGQQGQCRVGIATGRGRVELAEENQSGHVADGSRINDWGA